MSTKSQDKKYLFENMPVGKALASMAVPTVISQLINLIYNTADCIYIGRTGDPNKTAAVTVAFTIYMMTVSIANIFGIGGGSLMARLSGAGKENSAKSVCAFSFYGSIVFAVAYSLIVLLTLEPLLYLLGASAYTVGFAKEYVCVVVIAGDVPIILSMACAHLLRNSGYSKQASIGLSGGGALNIILDPLFMFVIFPEGREVFAAALATLVSNIISCTYLVITLYRVSRTGAPVSISLNAARRAEKQDVKKLFAVGLPAAALTALFDVANIVLNALMSDHGDLQVAAVGIVMKAERLPNAVNIGICQGMLPIVAYNFASGNRERMQKVINATRKTGLLIAVSCTVLYFVFASQLVSIFLSTSTGNIEDSATTLAFAAVFLKIRCFASVFQFLNYQTSHCLQAMGKGTATLLHALVREVVFYIPFMFLFNALFGINGLVSAIISGEACGAVFALILLKKVKKV